MRKHRNPHEDGMLDPDARFLLANERTFLAWVRTALAVLIGGIAVTQLGQHSQAQSTIGMMVILLGGVMALGGYLRFRAADHAIRCGELPKTGREPLVQTGAIMAVTIMLVVTHLFNIW